MFGTKHLSSTKASLGQLPQFNELFHKLLRNSKFINSKHLSKISGNLVTNWYNFNDYNIFCKLVNAGNMFKALFVNEKLFSVEIHVVL